MGTAIKIEPVPLRQGASCIDCRRVDGIQEPRCKLHGGGVLKGSEANYCDEYSDSRKMRGTSIAELRHAGGYRHGY